MSELVSLNRVCVSTHENRILNEVTLRVACGEFLGITGPNGAGKTTLLKVIVGLLRATSGDITIFGRRVSGAVPRDLRVEIGYLPQIAPVDQRMPISAWDVVLMARFGRRGLFRRPDEDDRRAARAAMEQTGVWRLSSRPVGRLSGGERQRVMLARAIAQEPRLLLLDEPTSSLDRQAQRELPEIVGALHRDSGLTTILVSHDHDLVERLCSRIVTLESGCITEQSAPARS